MTLTAKQKKKLEKEQQDNDSLVTDESIRDLTLEMTIQLEPTYPLIPMQFFLRLTSKETGDLKLLREAAQQFLDES